MPNDLCRRAFEYVSRDLDDDLAEFERALLHAHLASCEGCRSTRNRLIAQTTALRAAALEPLARPVSLPSRRKAFGRLLPAAAAAVVVAAIGAGGVLSVVRGSSGVPAQSLPVRLPFSESTNAVPRERRIELMNANMPASRAAEAVPDTKARFNAA